MSIDEEQALAQIRDEVARLQADLLEPQPGLVAWQNAKLVTELATLSAILGRAVSSEDAFTAVTDRLRAVFRSFADQPDFPSDSLPIMQRLMALHEMAMPFSR